MVERIADVGTVFAVLGRWIVFFRVPAPHVIVIVRRNIPSVAGASAFILGIDPDHVLLATLLSFRDTVLSILACGFPRLRFTPILCIFIILPIGAVPFAFELTGP